MRLRADPPETAPLILYMASTVRERPNYIGTKSGTTLGSVPGGPTPEASAPRIGPWLNLSSAVEVYWEHFNLRVKRAVSPYLFIFPILLPMPPYFLPRELRVGRNYPFYPFPGQRVFSLADQKELWGCRGAPPPTPSIFCPFQSVFCPFQSQRTLGCRGLRPPPLSALPISANANEHPRRPDPGRDTQVPELAGTSREPGNLRGNTAISAHP